jgi:geranylgeranyl pyrophosphate synthase
MGQHLLQGTQVSSAQKVRLYDLYFEALRAGHAGQAADIEGLDSYVPAAVDSGEADELVSKVLAIHRLKTAAPAGALARMGAIVGGGTEAQIEGLGRFFESIGVAFQMIDDVLNLRGFERGLKARGEDIAHGKVTLPVALGFGRLGPADRAWVWETLQTKPRDQAVIDDVIDKLEGCGAVETCARDARDLVEQAWERVEPLLEDSIVKLMLRAFGWYVLERHY